MGGDAGLGIESKVNLADCAVTLKEITKNYDGFAQNLFTQNGMITLDEIEN
jgi:hypothetical protein